MQEMQEMQEVEVVTEQLHPIAGSPLMMTSTEAEVLNVQNSIESVTQAKLDLLMDKDEHIFKVGQQFEVLDAEQLFVVSNPSQDPYLALESTMGIVDGDVITITEVVWNTDSCSANAMFITPMKDPSTKYEDNYEWFLTELDMLYQVVKYLPPEGELGENR